MEACQQYHIRMNANVITWKKANEGTSAAGYNDTIHIL
jgi:hypothetical protein